MANDYVLDFYAYRVPEGQKGVVAEWKLHKLPELFFNMTDSNSYHWLNSEKEAEKRNIKNSHQTGFKDYIHKPTGEGLRIPTTFDENEPVIRFQASSLENLEKMVLIVFQLE